MFGPRLRAARRRPPSRPCPSLAAAAVLTSLLVAACGRPDPVEDEGAVRALLQDMSEAWTAGDGRAWAAAFTEDARFTTWFGLRLQGREAIAEGHQFIFEDFYAHTTFDLRLRHLRLVGRDAAVATLEGQVKRSGEAWRGEPDAVPLAVLERRGRGWRIVAFQNTPYAVEAFRRNGDLRRFREMAARVGVP